MGPQLFMHDGTLGIGGLFRQGEFHDVVTVEKQIGVDRIPVAVLLFDIIFAVGCISAPGAGGGDRMEDLRPCLFPADVVS